MIYTKKEAKAYALKNMKGIWAAALNPFKKDYSFDSEGFKQNINHWIEDLEIDGLFICGKQGEFFSMSIEERKDNFSIAVDETSGRAKTIMSCSDQNFDNVVELGKHAQKIGADFIVVHAPVLNFISDRNEILYNYYKKLCDELDIGIAMWSHPDSGYLMEPELCAKISDLPNIVAIKYSVPKHMYAKLTKIVGDKILVSTASEKEWLDNIIELNWKVYLCSSPPYLLQTKKDKRMQKYTNLAFNGSIKEAKKVSNSLEKIREAFKNSQPKSKPHAHQKYWQELIGQVGGYVRFPSIELTNKEKQIIENSLANCGLLL